MHVVGLCGEGEVSINIALPAVRISVHHHRQQPRTSRSHMETSPSCDPMAMCLLQKRGVHVHKQRENLASVSVATSMVDRHVSE